MSTKQAAPTAVCARRSSLLVANKQIILVSVPSALFANTSRLYVLLEIQVGFENTNKADFNEAEGANTELICLFVSQCVLFLASPTYRYMNV